MIRISSNAIRLLMSLVPLTALPSVEAMGAALTRQVDFNRDIRPILSDHCFACHGPDEKQRKADLRLDIEEEAFADLGGYHAIVPEDPKSSELYRRISTDDVLDVMPPRKFERQLNKEQIELIRLWIEQGAKWQKHWSFITPKRPETRTVEHANQVRNPIDTFIFSRLERDGLAPSSQAEKRTLIRRVTLDLTGLPPTPEEVDAFLADDSPEAYEKVVDRLLASPHYGEKMAMQWLDLARYADTHGYHIDSHRDMWRWRDWVIDSFNANKPFDEFTVEQLAGDLLPNATLEQKIATGFNRNHMINYEGGAIPEEYRTQYVVDRVNTTSTVWMGLTMGCAQCHDHKYDPLTQKEFYQFFAFFNNIPEQGLDGQKGNAVPFIKAPDEDQQARLAKVRSKLAETESRLKELEPQLAETQRGWEKAKLASLEEPPATGLIGHYELDHHLVDTSGRYHHGHLQGAVPTYKPGIVNTALELPGNAHVDLAGDYAFDSDQAFSYGAWIRPNDTSHQAVLSKMHDEADFRGFDLYYAGKVFVHLVHAWDKNAIRVNTKADVAPGQWHHVFATYDGSSKSSGVTLYVDGQPQKLEVTHDSLNGTLQTDKSLRIGSRNAGAPFKGLLDDVRIYERRLSANEVRQLAQDEPLRSMLATAPDQRQNEQRQDLRKRFLSEGAAPEYKAPHDRLAQLRTREQQILNESPTTMVMAEMDKPRETFMLARGSYDNPGEKVFATIPSALPPLAENEPANRLGLARWLVSSDHPLTARVTVNRYWQMYFGRGIVKTSEDFGSQGEWPTHPDLLDWLATEFIESGWDVKALQRLIVTSAAYRQSVRVTPALLESDPQNVLMARGPRLRLSAELIRDQALFVSGLINLEIGGPSVKPYQPPGLWREVAFGREFTAQSYEQDHGDKLYRRSMYTFWKRSCPPPSLSTFDAPDREVCTASRARTNTPLQALVLMNDPTYVESARHFARRILMESGQSMRERIGYAYEVALARAPSDVEIEILERVYRNQYERFSYDITAALELISVGDSDLPVEADMIELAAWTTLAGMILNLDEIVTRG